MSESLALLTEAEKLARVEDAVGSSFAWELARVLRDLERELRTLALQAIGGSKTALSRAVRAAKLRQQIRQALEVAGYRRLATTATSAALDRVVAQLGRLRGAARMAAFTSADMSRILALKRLAQLDLFGQGDEIAHALWRTFAQGLFTQRSPSDVLDDLADVLDVEQRHARTLYDTTVSVFSRQVEAMKSTDRDVFVYLGPADVKLRPFCRAHVGKVYTRAEIEALDNGQMSNVYLTGGGYNCRHVWQAVSRIGALRNLQGTGQRMPEIEAALQRMPAGDRRAA